MRGLVPVVVPFLLACLRTAHGQGLRPVPDIAPPMPKPTDQTTDAPKNLTYWVTFSNKVRAGNPFEVEVLIVKGTSPVNVDVAIKTNDGTETIMSKSKEVIPGSVDTIVFDIPRDMTPPNSNGWWGQYVIEVIGQGQEVNFNQTRYSSYEQKSLSIFLQTNKAQYMPLQRVKVRCLAVNPDLSVITEVPWNIEVKDPEDHVMWQEEGKTSLTGVVDFSFMLADQVLSGDWKIHATVLGEKHVKEFTVEDYVLPKFEVELDMPAFASIGDANLPITVRAKYTFGQPVTDGSVRMIVRPRYYACTWRDRKCQTDEKMLDKLLVYTGKLDRQGEFKEKPTYRQLLDMLNDLIGSGSSYRYKNLSWQDFTVEAEVTETNIYKTQSEEGHIKFYPSPVKLELIPISPTNFKPGLKWKGYYEVSYWDGTKLSAVEAARLKVVARVEYRLKQEKVETTKPPLPIKKDPEDMPLQTKPPRPLATARIPTSNNNNNTPSSSKLTPSSGSSSSSGGGSGSVGGSGSSSSSKASSGNAGASTSNTGEDAIGSETERVAGPSFAADIAIAPGEHPSQTDEKISEHTIKVDSPYSIDENGWVQIEFEIPNDAEYVYITTYIDKYKEATKRTRGLNPAQSPSDSFIQLSVPPTRIEVGSQLTLTTKCTEPVSELYYQFYSKGLLVDSVAVPSTTPSTDGTYTFTVTRAMTPVLRVVVFYTRKENSEFVADAVTLNVDGLFQNKISLDYSAEIVRPGDDLTLTIKQDVGDKAAIVYLLANDKSVELLKSGFDITQELVREDITRYDYGGNYYPWMRFMFICGWPSYGNSDDAYSVFQDAGVHVVTDGDVYKIYNRHWWPEHAIPAADGLAGAGSSGDRVDETALDKESSTEFQEAERVRTKFDETWLWQIAVIPAKETEVTIKVTAPDTITSWPTTAFSVHPTKGLAVVEEPAQVTTFLPLSVHLDLPIDIVRHEEICFTASVFNYYETALPIQVRLDQSPDFDPVFLSYDGVILRKETMTGSYSSLKGNVEPNEVESTMFCIKPNRLGDVPVKVSALTTVPGLSDAVERVIKVKPEGVPRSIAYAHLIQVGGSETTPTTELAQYVEGSQYITVNIVGNLLGPLLDGIDKLLRMPYGCGEQNMVNFAPTTSLLSYYDRRNQMTDKILNKGREYMNIGYTKATRYRHSDGGFSTFGNNKETKEKGSLMLTAFIVKCFAQAMRMTAFKQTIDKDIQESAIDFLIKQQSSNGDYVENGKVFNKNLLGGVGSSSSKGVAQTAYTIIALHEALQVPSISTKVAGEGRASLNKADQFLKSKLSSLTDPYDLCITAYALQLVNSDDKNKAFDLAMKNKTEEAGSIFWRRPQPPGEDRNRYWWQRREDAISVEATSYCLLTLLARGEDSSDYLPIVRWMTTQRGPNSGFFSTQDTVIGIQALTNLPDSLYENAGLPYTVTVVYGEDSQQVTIEEGTQLMVHRVDVPYDAAQTSVGVFVSDAGNGGDSTVFAEVILGFNDVDAVTDQVFEASHKLTEQTDTSFTLDINVRTLNQEQTGMTLLSVDIPSGFQPYTEPLRALVSNVEVIQSTLVLYFNTDVIGPRWTNVKIVMTKAPGLALPVAEPKYYTFYLYYEPDKQISSPYIMETLEYCEEAKKFSMCPFYTNANATAKA